MKLTSGTSKRSLCKLQCNTEETIEHDVKEDFEKGIRVRQILKTLESKHSETFNEVINDMSCSSVGEESTTPSKVWVAMVDEAQLRLEQQRIINKHHYFVHGKRLTEPESKRRDACASACFKIF